MEFGDDRIIPEENLPDLTLVASYCDDSFDRSTQRTHLFKEIRNNIPGCDLILSLFISALQSYRANHCLRPFPPLYMDVEKDFTSLRNTCENIPPLRTLLTGPAKCSDEAYKLLTWLFIDKGYPVLRKIDSDSVAFPGGINTEFRPHYVFEVNYHPKAEDMWLQRKGSKDVIWAYHGSAVFNFYSILKVGLQQHFSITKEVLFGNGIYLSSEVSISAHYAPFGQTWKNSLLGHKTSIIALCEIINDVDKVKCKDSKNKKRSLNGNSLGEIPEKYFVVTDSDMVRVKYLLVYRNKSVFTLSSYLMNHSFVILIVIYFVIIVLVGFFNNSSSTRILKKLTQLFSLK